MASSTQLEFENPYQSTATLAEAAAIASATDELIELRAFVGPKFEHYLRKWHPRLEDPQNGDVGISWVGFFITAWWMGYRKMYAQLVLYLAASTAVMLGLQATFIYGLNQPEAPLLAVLIATVLVQVVCMLYANAWYLQHAANQISRLKSHGYKGNELLIQSARRGGTSGLGVVLSVFLSGMATLVGNVLAAIMMLTR
jgi:hypothetical protein